MRAPAPYLAQAAAMMEEGRFEEAQQLLLRHARGKAHPHAYYLLAIGCEALGQLEQAVYYAQKATVADPHDSILAIGLAQRLFTADRTKEAMAHLVASAAQHPFDPSILAARVAMLAKMDREEEALALADSASPGVQNMPAIVAVRVMALTRIGRVDEALALARAAGDPHANPSALLSWGRTEEAVAELRELCAKHPGSESLWTAYAARLNYVDDAPLEEVLRAHEGYGAAVRARMGPARTSWNLTPDPERKLRIGIVSFDLRSHAVVSFLAPLLENYDRKEWHVTGYSVFPRQDAVTARLRSLVEQWRWFPTAHTRLLARQMHEDRIDVAIELSGHTKGHQLDAMQSRPAPVQVTYLGYPNTTGLDTIDVRIVDSITDPPGSEKWATEKLARIDPCFLCFKPIQGAPELVPSAMSAACESDGGGARGGGIKFGSFNLPMKISPGTLAIWRRVLDAVPSSALVLKHAVLDKEWTREQLRTRLGQAGIDSARVTILPPAPSYAGHLGSYANVDIALDTYPYHGTTTTCEAMWMGVPVVTLLGDRHPARVGASLLTAVGLKDLVAKDAVDYVRIATALAADLDMLKAWRTPGPGSLRQAMMNSPLCDGPAFAARFQRAVREAWHAWCAEAIGSKRSDQ